MDSLTQLALGAGVGLAVLGPRVGPRRAALVGAVLGTLPDLDVVVPFDDPVDDFTLHRGPSHSLFVHAVVTPLFGEALMRLFKDLRGERLRAYLGVYLCFATHALIDAATIYGTRIFWPLWPEPFGLGSLFIIDPLYTLPLLVALIWALCLRAWTARFARVVATCLVLSTAYLGWSLMAQQIAQARAATLLASTGLKPDRLLAIPTPFNTLFWRAIALDGPRYVNLYLPLIGGADAATLYSHPRGTGYADCLAGNAAFAKLARFSDGFYRVDRRGGAFEVSDLRMGLTPSYVFRFAVAEATDAGPRAMIPERRRSERRAPGDLDWLFAGITGNGAPRPVEADATTTLAALAAGSADSVRIAACDQPVSTG